MGLDSFCCKMKINGSRHTEISFWQNFSWPIWATSPMTPFMGKIDSILYSDAHSPSSVCSAHCIAGCSVSAPVVCRKVWGINIGKQQKWSTLHFRCFPELQQNQQLESNAHFWDWCFLTTETDPVTALYLAYAVRCSQTLSANAVSANATFYP